MEKLKEEHIKDLEASSPNSESCPEFSMGFQGSSGNLNLIKQGSSEGNLNKGYWLEDLLKPGRVRVHESWFRNDTVNFWRHERMLEGVYECLQHTKTDSWLTVGDGRYGLDAIRLRQHGFTDVTSSDIDDSLIKLAYQAGLIQKYSREDAERFSFADNSFDYLLCKESLHHFPRPMLALYEMIRLARKAVVIIEPQDAYIDLPVLEGEHVATYEDSGNYVYKLSRRELEKIALGLNMPAIAFKSFYDAYFSGIEFELALESNPVFVDFVQAIETMEISCRSGCSKYNMLMAVMFSEIPDYSCRVKFERCGWSFESLRRNPHISQ